MRSRREGADRIRTARLREHIANTGLLCTPWRWSLNGDSWRAVPVRTAKETNLEKTGNVLAGLLGDDRRKYAAWSAAHPINNGPFAGLDFRTDDFGHIMRWSDYGTCGVFGWEVDHRIPRALGGTDSLSNLRAVNARMNRSMGGLLGNALARARTGLLG